MHYAEATPAYLTTPGTAELLKAYNPSLKIIVVVCEPSKRALSDFRHEDYR